MMYIVNNDYSKIYKYYGDALKAGGTVSEICKLVKEEYAATPGGNFRKKPFNTVTELVPIRFYNNYIDSISFFNGFCGGSCRGSKSYTTKGYLVTKVTTINPARDLKIIARFYFD